MANLISNVEIPTKLVVGDKEMDIVIIGQSTDKGENKYVD